MLGFGFNKTKVLASAERHLQQGRLTQAIADYQKILKHDARDLTVLNTVGDLYARSGQVAEATDCFQEVAEAYVQSGFMVKAIAVYKKLAKLNPSNMTYALKLGELYRNQGLHSDARSQFLQAAESLLKSGGYEEATRLYEKILEIDPENLTAQSKLAELYLRQSKQPQAAEVLLRLTAGALRRKSLDVAEQALAKLDSLLPDDARIAEFRGQLALERGNPKEAARYLESLPALQSSESGLRTLSKVHLEAGQTDKAIAAAQKMLADFGDHEPLLGICDWLVERQRIPDSLRLYQQMEDRLLQSPEVIERLQFCIAGVRDDPQALENIYGLLERAGDTSAGVEILEQAAEAWTAQGEQGRALTLYKRLAEINPQNQQALDNYRRVAKAELAAAPELGERDLITILEQTSGGYSDEQEGEIRTALAEAELQESFQDPHRAVETLEKALVNARFDPRLNQQLLGLYLRMQRYGEAAECCDRLSRVCALAGKHDQSAEFAQQAAQYRAHLAPAMPAPAVPPAPAQSTAAPTPAEAASSNLVPLTSAFGAGSAIPDHEQEIDISDEWEQHSAKPAEAERVQSSDWFSADSRSGAPPQAPPPQPAPAATGAGIAAQVVKDLVEEIRFYLSESLLSEAEYAVEKLAELDPSYAGLPGFREQLGKLAARARSGEALPTQAAIPAAPPEIIHEERTPPPAPRPGDRGLEIALGPVGDLGSRPGGLPKPQPDSLTDFVNELESALGSDFKVAPQAAAPPAASAAPPARPATPSPAASVPPPSPAKPPQPEPHAALSEVFQEFKQEVEGEIPAEDPEVHYSLGLAFQEMGLLDEAIGEFQKVCQAIEHGQVFGQPLQAYTWLAHCLVLKGVPEASFRWYERALKVVADDESRIGVHYELAAAYEAAGQKTEALRHYMEVYGTNIDYRDVAQRIKALKSQI